MTVGEHEALRGSEIWEDGTEREAESLHTVDPHWSMGSRFSVLRACGGRPSKPHQGEISNPSDPHCTPLMGLVGSNQTLPSNVALENEFTPLTVSHYRQQPS